MGGQASSKLSTPTPVEAQEKALMDLLRFRTMTIREGDDYDQDEFVHVHNEKSSEASSDAQLIHRKPHALEVETLEGLQRKLMQDPKNQLALAALSSADPKTVLMSRAARISDQQVFNVRIPFEGAPITNQRRSGRCWLFASTNTFRIGIMKRYNLDSFELSQAYLFFWDKLEKANYFLENIIQTADQDLDGRLVQRLLQDPVSDGGQWDMVYNLVDKYGLVPQVLYPDSFNAESSSTLNYIVVAKLREFAITLRNIINDKNATGQSASIIELQLAKVKAKMMQEIQLILTVTLGPPPSSTEAFTWDYLDKSGRAHTLKITPRNFARNISTYPIATLNAEAISDLVSLVHDPRHEPLTLLTVDRLGNIVGKKGVTYINVDIGTLKKACVATLKAGIPIFFGCDVGKFSNTAAGIMDLDLINYRLGFNTDILNNAGSDSSKSRSNGGLTKAERLRVGESAMTHAMVLTAVHVDEKSGETIRWRVQNSWGEDAGSKGWFVMSDAWMDEFVYQAVVHPKFLSKEVRDVLKKEPVVLPLWDPMGSLA